MELQPPALLPSVKPARRCPLEVLAAEVDVDELRAFLLVRKDLSLWTVDHRIRSLRHMQATGFDVARFLRSPAAARKVGERWLAWKKRDAGRSCLHNYELVLNDLVRWRAERRHRFAALKFVHTKPLYGHPEPYSPREYRALQDYRTEHPFVELRRRAMLWLCRHTGLRRSEIARLDVEDLDEDLGVIYVRRPAKRGKPRAVPAPTETWSSRRPVQAYLRARRALLEQLGLKRSRVWISSAGSELSPHMMSKEMHDISVELGFAVSFNRFRRTWATQLARAGVGLATLQALYGHNDPKSTRWYFEPTTEDLRRDLRRHKAPGFVRSRRQRNGRTLIAARPARPRPAKERSHRRIGYAEDPAGRRRRAPAARAARRIK